MNNNMTEIKIIPIHEAKSNLSELIKRAELRKQAFGCMKGIMKLPEGWGNPLSDDIIELFYSNITDRDFIR